MIAPPPAVTMTGAMAAVKKYGALMFTSYTSSKVTSSVVVPQNVTKAPQ